MIWITTLCLLLVAAWLFFNAVNERRWVEAHSHDEAVASDEGLFSGFTVRTSTGSVGPDGKMSINQENSGFSRAVTRVQETTSKYGDKFFESKVAAARSSSDDPTGDNNSPTEDVVTRTTRKVASKADDVKNMVSEGAKNISQGISDSRSADGGLFGSVVNKVSGTMEKMESGMPKTANIRKAAAEHKDIVSRMAAKVGDKVNTLDSKYVGARKKVAEKLDRD